MAAFVWRGGEEVGVEEVPWPARENGRAVVAVAYAGVCGTDLHLCAGEHPRAQRPRVLGAEVVGPCAHGAAGLAAGRGVAVEPLRSWGRCRPCRSGRAHVCERLRLMGI